MTEKKSSWKKVQAFFNRWQRFIPIIISAIMGGYIIFLLGINYVSQVKMQEFSLQYLQQNVEKQAIVLSNFFQDRIKDSKHLASSREIDIFFENKALGMSMEYGLKNSLTNMEKRFSSFLNNAECGSEKCFCRAVFMNAVGELLVDYHIPDVAHEKQKDLKQFLNPKNSNLLFISGIQDGLPEMLISIPCFLKDKYMGQILVWLYPPSLSYNFIAEKKTSPEMLAGLIDQNDSIYLLTVKPFKAVIPKFSGFKPYEGKGKIQNMYSFEMLSKQGDSKKMLTVKTEIEDTPFCLLVALPKSLVLGDARPEHLLIALGSVTLFFIIIIAFLMRLNLRNAILGTRLEEGTQRTIEIEKKVKERTFELSEVNTQLNQEILERKQTELDLKTAQAQLIQSEKLASLGQLSAGIAHEINNPLGFISNNVEILGQYVDSYSQILRAMDILKKMIETNDLEKAKSTVEDINDLEEKVNLDYITNDIDNLIRQSKSGLERIKKIVQDLKIFARKDEGQMELNNVEEVIDGVINIVWSEIKYTAELKKEYAGIPLVRCNAQKLGQVFINLLINAAQAIEDKGEIIVKTYVSDKYACIEFSDTGSGISPENISKIFDPFFTTKVVGEGTGLGLSIGYDIVKQHKGKMEVDSGINKGTKFTIKLPI